MFIKKFFSILFAFSFVLLLSSCGRAVNNKIDKVDFPLFTKHMIMNDFDELIDILEKNYPHFNTVRRMYGVDKDAVIERYKGMLENHTETFELREVIEILTDFVNEFVHVGHFRLYNADAYEQVFTMVKGFASTEEIVDDTVSRMYEILSRDTTVRTYDYLKNNDIPINSSPLQNQRKEEIPSTVEACVAINTNLSYKIIDENSVYLSIHSFENSHIDNDFDELINFYEQIKDYENLIIDISRNGGGSATLYPLNLDGSCNTEFGTKPDFYADDYQSALEACLLIINSKQH